MNAILKSLAKKVKVATLSIDIDKINNSLPHTNPKTTIRQTEQVCGKKGVKYKVMVKIYLSVFF